MLICIPKLELLNLLIHLILNIFNTHYLLVTTLSLLWRRPSNRPGEFVDLKLVNLVIDGVFVHNEVIKLASNAFPSALKLIR